MKSTRILERINLGMDFVPVDMSTGANNGTWHCLKAYQRCVFLLVKATGASGEPPTITIQQASDVSGTGAKGLNFTTIYTKLGASTTPGPWTKVTQAAASTYALAAGNTLGLVAIEIDGAQLDVANNFKTVRANIADVGATAQIGAVIFILGDERTEAAPENLVDPTVN